MIQFDFNSIYKCFSEKYNDSGLHLKIIVKQKLQKCNTCGMDGGTETGATLKK